MKYWDSNLQQYVDIPMIIDPLPDQSGQNGKYLTTDGTNTSWGTVNALPSQSGQSGKFLTTNGTSASWESVEALPSQSGKSGKFLTTDGANASWETVDALPNQSGQNGKFLTTNGTTASWTTIDFQVFHVGTSAPSNTRLLWIDTTSGSSGLKYYNGSSWVAVPTFWM